MNIWREDVYRLSPGLRTWISKFIRRSFLIFVQQTMQISALILRLPCKSTAEFSVVIRNMALTGFVIEEMPHVCLAECKMQCLFNEKCKSINYKAQGSQLCQLNSKTSEDSQDADAVLHNQNGWTFLSTNYTSSMVSIRNVNTIFQR